MVDKTVKIRALVVIDSDGSFGVYGYNGCDFGDCVEPSAQHLNGGPENQFWLEIDLPIPEAGETAKIVEPIATEHAIGIDPNTQ